MTSWTVGHQAPLFMEFSRQEYCSGLPCPPPGDLPNPAIKRRSPAAAAAKSLQSCLTLCNPMDYSPPDSSVHGILQARILQWVAMPSSRGLFPTQGYQTCNSHAADGFFTTEALGTPLRYHVHEADFTRSFESLTK